MRRSTPRSSSAPLPPTRPRAGPGGALVAALSALALCSLGACKADHTSKIEGWPPPESTFRDTVVVELDTVEPPDTAPAPVDTTPVDPDALPSEPCAALVELACRYYGGFSEECGEARSRPPDGSDPETRSACQDLVTRYVSEEQDKRLNPCRRYARLVCRDLGADTRACQVASAAVQRLLTQRQQRACLGDLLMHEARTLRR